MSVHVGDKERELYNELARVRAKLKELRARLKEPEEIIRAIRHGEVDAFVVTDPRGEKIYSLRSADVLYRRMVEEMKEGAVALELSGLIVYCNGYFANLMKTDQSALVGTSIFPFVPEESRRFFDALGTHSGVETSRSEFVLRAADGLLVPVYATMNRIEIEGGPVFCLIVIDQTEERHREQLLAESRQKDEFLAMLAHELRNPIAPILNATHVIALSRPAEPRVRWARDVIERQVLHLSRLVDDLLDISRITRGKIRLDMQPVDLEMAIRRGIETAQPAIEARRHQLSVDMPGAPLRVMGDDMRVSQVVANILHNAAKFTPEGGQIRLTVERREAEARIVVRDNGMGIRPEMLPKIFDLFTQVDSSLERAQGGLGIGLALVRNLVEMHGGRVEVKSDGPGRGSEFAVWLPLLPTSSQDTAAAKSAAVEATAQPAARRILVVDDNRDTAESLTFVLQDLGHDVRMVTEGRKVLEAAQQFRPHMILLDISLPDMSGFEVAVELRRCAELCRFCLVALTGYGQEDYRRQSSEAGFDYHWVKPVRLATLMQILNSLPAEP